MDDLLISLLPPDAVGIVRALCELIAVSSLLALAIKKALGEPKANDPEWRMWLFSALHWLDVAAANTETVRSKLRRLDDESMRKIKPRKPPPIPPLTMLVLALTLAAPMQACASTLKTHATAADVSAQLIDQAGAAIEQRARAAEEAALAASATRDVAAQQVAEARARSDPLEAAYETLRSAHASYVAAIVRADHEGREQLEPDPLHAIGIAWAHLAQLAEALGVKVPGPPDELVELLGGAR